MQVNRVQKDRVAQRAHAWNLMIGDTLVSDLTRQGLDIPPESTDPEFCQFIHALNTSDWVTAAYFLHGGESSTIEQVRSRNNLLCSSMAHHNLDPLYHAADRFRQDRSEWQEQLQQAYQFGKLPAFGPRVVAGKTAAAPYAANAEVVEHGRKLTRLIPIFQEYEKINQLYQKPGHTLNGVPIRFTQGHNWSYGHILTDILGEKDASKGQRRILVNWDAHRDLSSPFGHLSREMSLLMQWMQIDHDRLLWLIRHAKTSEQIAEVTSMISIAGWILPLLYSQIGVRSHLAEIVLVVPREAMKTSKQRYWPDYGTHTIGVGHAALDHQQIDELHHVMEQNELYRASIRSEHAPKPAIPSVLRQHLDASQKNIRCKSLQSVSHQSNLGTLQDGLSGILQNIQNVKVHIVDPDLPNSLQQHLVNAKIHLSVDVDFAGTNHLGGWYSASNPSPHYPLNKSPEEELRHLQLIDRFRDFYQSNSQNIAGVSVANSPDYTAAETRRRPAAKIFEILTAGTSGKQPNWIAGELNRELPPQLQKHPSRDLLISLAGILGISITGALFWHYLRCHATKKDFVRTEA
jgi:hypothetical protein